MAASLGSAGCLGLVSWLAATLLWCLALRFALAWRRLPEGEGRISLTLDTMSPEWMELARAELALLWFGLFRWRRRAADAPSTATAFAATEASVEATMCWLTAGGFVIETPLIHILLAHAWSMAAAWISTGLHSLLGVYLIGYAKSLSFRPTLLFADRIEIRLGVVASRIVPLPAINRLTLYDHAQADRPVEQRLFGFEEPNLRLSTAGAHIAFRVDEPTRLIAALSPAS